MQPGNYIHDRGKKNHLAFLYFSASLLCFHFASSSLEQLFQELHAVLPAMYDNARRQ